MNQDGGAFWRPPGWVWVCVRDDRVAGYTTRVSVPDPSRSVVLRPLLLGVPVEAQRRLPFAALTKTTSLTGSSGVRKTHQRRSNGVDSPLPSPSPPALLCRWGESKQGAVPGLELHRALLDPRGKRRRNETAQGHPGCPGVLSPPCRRGQLRTESWTGTGISAQCRIIRSRTTKERKINSGSQAISLLLEHCAFGEALHHRVAKPTQFTALKRLQ